MKDGREMNDADSSDGRDDSRALGGGESNSNSFQVGEEGQAPPVKYFDTHCHIHFDDFGMSPDTALKNAVEAGVEDMMLVGCTLEDSESAFKFVDEHPDYKCHISIGLHPHEGSHYADDQVALDKFAKLAARPETKAIGETGLDYYYENSPKETQKKLLKFQLDLAQEHDLPLIFHIRDAFEDFFEIFDTYTGLRGVVHCFSATERELGEILKRDLYVGLNGIMTFTKDEKQLAAAKAVPLNRMVLETDAPYLTPKPFRGTICEPKYVATTAAFLADLRGEKLEDIAQATTANAKELFGF